MKLVLFSDSHGNVANMADVVRLEHPDRVLHMGDLARDAEELARQFPDIPVTYVPGNCDGRRPDLPDERRFTLEGCKILMTHGHTYHVKAGPEFFSPNYARSHALVFLSSVHQLICPDNEFSA